MAKKSSKEKEQVLISSDLSLKPRFVIQSAKEGAEGYIDI